MFKIGVVVLLKGDKSVPLQVFLFVYFGGKWLERYLTNMKEGPKNLSIYPSGGPAQVTRYNDMRVPRQPYEEKLYTSCYGDGRCVEWLCLRDVNRLNPPFLTEPSPLRRHSHL